MSDLTLIVGDRLDSPYAMSAFVALEEKKLSYRLEPVSLQRGDHKKPDYQGQTGRVPALIHGSYVLCESSAIGEYLADVFPFPDYPRIFPKDFKDRGLCRMVQAWVRSDFMPIREERGTATIFYKEPVKPLSEKAQADVKRLLRGVEPLIGSKTTLFDEWCIADCDLALMLQRLNLNGERLPPNVKAYAEANWQRPSVAKWVGLKRPV